MKKSKNVYMAFRTDEDQAARIQRMAEQTGQPSSAVIRQIIDSALLVQRPVIVSNYQQPAVHRGQ